MNARFLDKLWEDMENGRQGVGCECEELRQEFEASR